MNFIRNINADHWDPFIRARHGHLLQSYAWGEFKARFGWIPERIALEEHGELIAGAQVLYRRLPLGLTTAYVPRGPIVDPNDISTFNTFLDALQTSARAHHALALKLEPNWAADPSLAIRLSSSGFRHTSQTVQPPRTIRIDLTRDPDAILAAMKPKWRYNIRLAQKKGVTIRQGTLDDVPTFYRLLQTTSTREHFAIHSLEYYRAAYEILSASDAAHLFIAQFRDEPLAAIFIGAFGGEAIYLYGGSSNAHRNLMPNHLNHWQAIQWAKARGCTVYDMWGVPEGTRESESQDEDAKLPEGLYRFKMGFGGAFKEYLGAWDFVLSPALYALFTRALKIRRRLTTR